MWGAEMGANEHNVIIGNEAVWTKEPTTTHNGKSKALLGMDLVRLGLERGSTAREALNVITNLLETHGQAGPCAENDSSFTYHNSFLIVDPKEAYVLETAGIQWVAQRITEGVRNISNCLSIGTNWDLSSKNVIEYAIQKGYWKENNKDNFNFAKAYSCDNDDGEDDPRFCGGRQLLQRHNKKGTLDHNAMIDILRTHDFGICMHGGFESTSSWVSELYVTDDAQQKYGVDDDEGQRTKKTKTARHWATGQPYPCKSPFLEQEIFINDKKTNDK